MRPSASDVIMCSGFRVPESQGACALCIDATMCVNVLCAFCPDVFIAVIAGYIRLMLLYAQIVFLCSCESWVVCSCCCWSSSCRSDAFSFLTAHFRCYRQMSCTPFHLSGVANEVAMFRTNIQKLLLHRPRRSDLSFFFLIIRVTSRHCRPRRKKETEWRTRCVSAGYI